MIFGSEFERPHARRAIRRATRRTARVAASLVLAAGGLANAQPAAPASPAAACSRLASLESPQARVVSAEWVAQGTPIVLWQGGQATPVPRAFCRVALTASPVSGSEIGIEVWLPAAAEWNGKYLQVGNGGFAGSVPLPGLAQHLLRGYAAAGTDSGHRSNDGLDASWARGQPQRVVDWGWRAVSETSRLARLVIRGFHAQAPGRSYFVGCSNGGRDALMAAQRFPRDFDGIVSGAAAADWTGMMIGQALIQREVLPPRSLLPARKLPALQAASRRACAAGADHVRDPLACRFDPMTMLCTGADGDDCLTAEQAQLVRRIYQGMPDPVTGRWLPGLEPGTEAEPGHWDFSLLAAPTNPLGPNRNLSFAESFFRHLVRGDPALRVQDLETADFAAAQRLWRHEIDAVDPDLRAFRDRGGKLLQYHGWSDSVVPPRMSIAYQQALRERMGPVDAFHRLYMVPGMNHCGGGRGPWQVDWLAALERWVEQGESPGALAASLPGSAATQTLVPLAPEAR